MAGLLLDVSAWAHSGHPTVRARWAALVEAGELRCHPVFAIELLHSARTPEHYQRLRSNLEDAFEWLRPDAETARVALRIQQSMATATPCGQRVKTPDILIAALAAQHELGVLHYDSDYDSIRTRGGEPFVSEWLAERDSLESRAEQAVNVRKAYRKALGERLVQLQGDEDLEVWPALIAWFDEQLRARGIAPPPQPDTATRPS